METKEFYINVTPPTGDYNDVENKPAINGVVLTSNTTLTDLGLDSVFSYKGQVSTKSQLPSSGNKVGDTYDVKDTGLNYAWNGTEWDEISRKDTIYIESSILKHNNVAITIDSTKNKISGLKQSDISGLESAISSKANSSDLSGHTSNTSNPHGVTKAQVGLGNVDNTSDANKPISTATQNALNTKDEKPTITTLTQKTTLVDNHIFRANEMASIELVLPTSYDDDFICEVDFTSGSTPTALTVVDTIKWSGDDISNGVFVPTPNKRYTIFIWYDGMFIRAKTEGVGL
jgi:hypothetical protein